MKDYIFQYRREQRFEKTFVAETEDDAREAAQPWVAHGDLGTDVSDDEGELELIEVQDRAPEPVSRDSRFVTGVGAVLDLSTQHVHDADPVWGDLRVSTNDHGWIVHVSGEPMPNEPAWIAEVLAYARQNDCLLVNFDEDGEVLDFLPKWEW